MFKILRSTSEAQKKAEASIKKSEACAGEYHESLEKNAEAHAHLMEKLDRRNGPRQRYA